jgi:hypothetical protein
VAVPPFYGRDFRNPVEGIERRRLQVFFHTFSVEVLVILLKHRENRVPHTAVFSYVLSGLAPSSVPPGDWFVFIHLRQAFW